MTKTYCDWCKKEIKSSEEPVKMDAYRDAPIQIDIHWDLCGDCWGAAIGVAKAKGYAT